MIPIVPYGGSKEPCPSGICSCWAASNEALRPALTIDQWSWYKARTLVQYTKQQLLESFRPTFDAPENARRAQELLARVTDLSGGTPPRIETWITGHPQIVYFLNTHGNIDLPVLPGICRNGPFRAIGWLLLIAHSHGWIKLESVIMETADDLA